MKKKLFFRAFLSCFILIVLLPGCKQSPDTISERIILRGTNTQLKQKETEIQYKKRILADYVSMVKTGFYEEPDTLARLRLRELAAADLITYKAYRYAWWEKSKKTEIKSRSANPLAVYVYNSILGTNWNGKSYYTVKSDDYHFIRHYIVEVALTEKGEKLVKDLPEARNSQDEEESEQFLWDQTDFSELENIKLRKLPKEKGSQNTEDPKKYPWNQKSLAERWPEIENPFMGPNDMSQVNAVNNKNVNKSLSRTDSDKIIRIDSLQYKGYLNFKMTEEKKDTVYLKAFSLKAVNASDIQIYVESGFKKCIAKIDLVQKKVTDAGRIDFGVMEGALEKEVPAVLDFYFDKGWYLDVNAFEEALDERF